MPRLFSTFAVTYGRLSASRLAGIVLVNVLAVGCATTSHVDSNDSCDYCDACSSTDGIEGAFVPPPALMGHAGNFAADFGANALLPPAPEGTGTGGGGLRAPSIQGGVNESGPLQRIGRVRSGDTFRLHGDSFGRQEGVVTLKFGAKAIDLTVKSWSNDAVVVELSKFQVSRLITDASIRVYRENGDVAEEWLIDLMPRPTLEVL